MPNSLSISIGICLFCALLLVSRAVFKSLQKKRRIKAWKQALALDKHQTVFKQLYDEIDGFQLSKIARQEQDAPEFVYGEIEFLPFIALLSLTKLDKDSVFYDLGSGIGKAVIACAQVYTIKEACGIEKFPGLHKAAEHRVQVMEELESYTPNTQNIHFIQGDFLACDLQNATHIFINASTFIGDLWQNIQNKLEELPNCQFVITTGKTLDSQNYSLLYTKPVEMSWGVVFAHVYQRQN